MYVAGDTIAKRIAPSLAAELRVSRKPEEPMFSLISAMDSSKSLTDL
jgi:hypothetical protein